MIDPIHLLKRTGSSTLGKTAYDTSWVARLNDIDSEMANGALSWICSNQLPDGSWGSHVPLYYHDRIVCTLGAMIALTHRGRRGQDRIQVEKGLAALDRLTLGATQGLRLDPNGATVGFEMIVPTLVAHAEKIGIIKQQGDRILGRLKHQRQAKMAKLNGVRISRFITAAHSAEMMGTDQLHLLDKENIQELNGSVGNSPAATAYYLLYVDQNNTKAFEYLKNTCDGGGAPTITPIEIFERIWVLWNITLAGLHQDNKVLEQCQTHIDYIERNWQKGKGIGFSQTYSIPDGDDTCVGFDLLISFGRKADIDAVLAYEEKEWFRCFPLEVLPSLDVNIHALGALRKAGFDKTHPAVQKVLRLLHTNRQSGSFWFDKWHLSPYYTTAHAIIHCQEYDLDLCRPAVEWMVKSQKADGSWGFCGFSTAEETAYCLQALSIWKRAGNRVPIGRLQLARDWLLRHLDPPYPPLWLDKSLYSPEVVVQAAIISALELSKEVQ